MKFFFSKYLYKLRYPLQGKHHISKTNYILIFFIIVGALKLSQMCFVPDSMLIASASSDDSQMPEESNDAINLSDTLDVQDSLKNEAESIAKTKDKKKAEKKKTKDSNDKDTTATEPVELNGESDYVSPLPSPEYYITEFFDKHGKEIRNRILGIHSNNECFPDTQAVQLSAALALGVHSVKDREDAERRKKELVYIGSNPYYKVDYLSYSIPYLVPKAALLLQDIGRAFCDSVQRKGIGNQYRIVVTSVLRSEKDVTKLRKSNGNATENSCHLYGTTIDISYVKFRRVESSKKRTDLRDCPQEKLKNILSEVLRDFRDRQRCYVKFEKKQSVYHITVR